MVCLFSSCIIISTKSNEENTIENRKLLKHIEIDLHVVREKLKAKLFHLLPIYFAQQLADIFNKSPKPKKLKKYPSLVSLISMVRETIVNIIVLRFTFYVFSSLYALYFLSATLFIHVTFLCKTLLSCMHILWCKVVDPTMHFYLCKVFFPPCINNNSNVVHLLNA